MTEISELEPSRAADMARLHAMAFGVAAAWSEDAITHLLSQPAVKAIGKKTDGALHAFIIVQLIAPEAEILTLATDPSQQRQGYAGELLSETICRLLPLGASNWLLDVAADNHRAIAFYKKHGFGIDGRRANYYKRLEATRADAILMSKPVGRQVTP